MLANHAISSAPNKTYLHPLPVRIWHWVNAAGFVLLILTGLRLVLRRGDQ